MNDAFYHFRADEDFKNNTPTWVSTLEASTRIGLAGKLSDVDRMMLIFDGDLEEGIQSDYIKNAKSIEKAGLDDELLMVGLKALLASAKGLEAGRASEIGIVTFLLCMHARREKQGQ